MKYSVHSTEAAAIAENERLVQLFGFSDEDKVTYSTPMELEAGWCLRVKESGNWKADHLANNVQEINIQEN